MSKLLEKTFAETKSTQVKLENDSDKSFSRAIRVRIYPNKAQKELMFNSFNLDKYIFNWFLGLKKSRWENHRDNLGWHEASKMVTLRKKSVEYDWMNIPSRSVIEQSLQKVDKAYQNFFKSGFGFPKFKKRGQGEKSFVLTDPTRLVGDSHMKLPKIGTLKVRGLRKFEGEIKNVTVKMTVSGEYYATFVVSDMARTIREKTENGTLREVGIDVNIENFLTDSNKNRIENPRFKLKHLAKIKSCQRKLAKLRRKTSSKKKGNVRESVESNTGDSDLLPKNQSRKYRKLQQNLAVIHRKITNKKSDFLHKLSHNYVKNHDKIKVENLAIKNMVKNHCLAEAIMMVSWGEFFRQLEYKSDWYGVEFERVDPKFTSKNCSACGETQGKMTLKTREFACQSCGVFHVRDENAAQNILKKEKISVAKTKTKLKLKLIEVKVETKVKVEKQIKKTGKGIVRGNAKAKPKAGGGMATQVLAHDPSKVNL